MSGIEPCPDMVRSRLDEYGFAVVKTENLDGFYAICNLLGKISQTIEVRLNPEKDQYPYCADAVPFHTDHPHVPIVAWYCNQQDADNGANLLVDSREIVCKMSTVEQEALQKIQLRVFHCDEYRPLLRSNPYHIYWLPVVIQEALTYADTLQAAAITSFHEELVKQMENVVSLKLNVGEALFVNNRIMLHGRHAIAQNSIRHLTRAYVV